MPLSWNEIKQRALRFSREWTGATRERSESQTFWNEFFDIFGVRRRTVAAFEEPVKNIRGKYGFIDLFWKGHLIVEQKSHGKDLSQAESQAFEYIRDLASSGRQQEIPRFVIISDFGRIALHDLEPDEQGNLPLFDQWRVRRVEFPLAELHRHIHEFGFIAGYKSHRFEEQDPINIQAVEIMGTLHDALEAGGYEGHDLERLLVRVLFCLFGEDTGIFEPDSFRLFLEHKTAADGSDLGPQLARLFSVLNTPREKRQTNLDEDLNAFDYVNGGLFSETLGFAEFNSYMRNALLSCTRFDWSRISPAVFGALFQSIMEPKERRQIGAHYTSERDILKVARSLFLDALREEFTRIKSDKNKLRGFHEKISKLRFLDPACGCGNFLVITYRELRLLEIDVLKALYPGEAVLDIQQLSKVDVDQFYGIEIEEWPVRIAEVAMWLMDHQMNVRLSEAFGQYFKKLPLVKSATILHGNALRLDWKTLLPPANCSYILGNPPFIGAKYQSDEQRADMEHVAGSVKNHGLLDFVTGWYFKAAEYIKGTQIAVAFVSTNSISQGEQVGVLWNDLFQRHGIKIHFAHRTFPWASEARGKAHVHVVIIGFGAFDITGKKIYEYTHESSGRGKREEIVSVQIARNISPYLIDGSDLTIINRSKPISDVPEISFGNQPIDGGNLVIEKCDLQDFLNESDVSKKFIRPYIGAEEFLNAQERWCLWLKNVTPSDIQKNAKGLR